MKPQGRSREKAFAEFLAEEQLEAAEGMGAICSLCGDMATWAHSPDGPHLTRCDVCVPRGCDCQVDDNWPCVEWDRPD